MNRKAYAKINLSLDVRGRRPDGYHLVDMIMQTVSLCDDIIMEPDDSGKISLTVTDERENAMSYMGTDGGNLVAKSTEPIPTDGRNLMAKSTGLIPTGGGNLVAKSTGLIPTDGGNLVAKPTEPIPTDGRNLMVRAALLMKERYMPGLGIRMRLIKRIPSEAGLGGGSSDAAEVLKGLNEFYGLGITDLELCEAAAHIGSDVPFFIYGGTVRATDTGTALKRLRPIKDHGMAAGIPLYALVVKPKAGNSTPRIYAGYDRLMQSGLDHKRPDVDAQEAAIQGKAGETSVTEESGTLAEELLTERTLTRTSTDVLAKTIVEMTADGAADMFINNVINVLEYPAVASLGLISEIKEKLTACGAAAACMTGSGTAVYGLYRDRETMSAAAKMLSASGLMAEISGIFETELI